MGIFVGFIAGLGVNVAAGGRVTVSDGFCRLVNTGISTTSLELENLSLDAFVFA